MVSESCNDLGKMDGNSGVRAAHCQTEYRAGRLGFH